MHTCKVIDFCISSLSIEGSGLLFHFRAENRSSFHHQMIIPNCWQDDVFAKFYDRRKPLFPFPTLSLAVFKPAVCFCFTMGWMTLLTTSTLCCPSMCVNAVIHQCNTWKRRSPPCLSGVFCSLCWRPNESQVKLLKKNELMHCCLCVYTSYRRNPPCSFISTEVRLTE